MKKIKNSPEQTDITNVERYEPSTDSGLTDEQVRKRYECGLVNDDKPLLRFSEQGVDVWGSPWDGKHRLSRNASASLQAVIFLRRGMENRIRPMTAVDAFPFLLSQTYSSDDMQTMEKIAGMQQILLRQIRFYRLECNMEPEAAMTAWKGVRGE